MGGQSLRMGTDKSQLLLNGQTLAQIAACKLHEFTEEVYFSINTRQQHLELENTIVDHQDSEGPLSGIIASLKAVGGSIMVLGVDMPLITKESIKRLINERNWDLLTTTFYYEQKSTWEPMLSIWEYETLPCLEDYFDQGGRSIQKFLNQYGNQRVPIMDAHEFTNVNTKEQFDALQRI